MSFLQKSASRSLRFRSTIFPQPRPFSSRSALFAGDYGSGEGDPKGERPQEQGRNPQVHKEHPGPPPPSSAEKGSSGSSESSSHSQNAASPKLHSDSQPAQETEDVKKHNAEFESRDGRTKNDPSNEKVDPKYWKGERSFGDARDYRG